ncbi:MAG: hypothetical protein HYX24_05580 [Candidatus Aenigmarchaeota archaeon]|nr:hypothetical protein [Candidatus Aenigmarchaeota archaeon]
MNKISNGLRKAGRWIAYKTLWEWPSKLAGGVAATGALVSDPERFSTYGSKLREGLEYTANAANIIPEWTRAAEAYKSFMENLMPVRTYTETYGPDFDRWKEMGMNLMGNAVNHPAESAGAAATASSLHMILKELQ